MKPKPHGMLPVWLISMTLLASPAWAGWSAGNVALEDTESWSYDTGSSASQSLTSATAEIQAGSASTNGANSGTSGTLIRIYTRVYTRSGTPPDLTVTVTCKAKGSTTVSSNHDDGSASGSGRGIATTVFGPGASQDRTGGVMIGGQGTNSVADPDGGGFGSDAAMADIDATTTVRARLDAYSTASSNNPGGQVSANSSGTGRVEYSNP